MEEFTFKIALVDDDTLPQPDPGAPPRVSLVRGVLQALLETVVLTSGGAEVTVDGFRFTGEAQTHPIWPTTG